VGPEYVTLTTEKTLRINRAIKEMNLRVVNPEADEGWRCLDRRLCSTPYVLDQTLKLVDLDEKERDRLPKMVMDLWPRVWPLVDDEKFGIIWQP
jgi:hypothetical protein